MKDFLFCDIIKIWRGLMGFFNGLKNISNRNKERKAKKEQKSKEVNKNPTEEQLKNNKKGKLAYLWAVISIIVYVFAFGMVATAWEENFALGILALLLVLTIAPLPHRKAISLAKEQRAINGKGLIALLFASFIPLIVLAGGFFFFVFGGMYFWK